MTTPRRRGMLDTTDPRACLKLTQCISTCRTVMIMRFHCVNGIWKAKSHLVRDSFDATGTGCSSVIEATTASRSSP